MTDVIIGGGISLCPAVARLSADFEVILLEAENILINHFSERSGAAFIEGNGNDTTREPNEFSFNYIRSANGGALSSRGLLLLAYSDQHKYFVKLF